MRTGIFNVAEVAITFGAIAIGALTFRQRSASHKGAHQVDRE